MIAIRNPVLTGRHVLLYLLPRKWRARFIARAVVKKNYQDWNFEKEPIYLLTAWGDFEIYDHKGRVRETRAPRGLFTPL